MLNRGPFLINIVGTTGRKYHIYTDRTKQMPNLADTATQCPFSTFGSAKFGPQKCAFLENYNHVLLYFGN